MCLHPTGTGSILLVALLKPVPVLNFDFAMFMFQVPTCRFFVCPKTTATAATTTRTPATAERVMRRSLHDCGTLLTLGTSGIGLSASRDWSLEAVE